MPEEQAKHAAPQGDFTISRELDAQRALVWQCFTDAQQMKHWWGPKGFKVIHSKMDLRTGGMYHYGLRTPQGQEMWGRFVYSEIVAPERITFVSSFSDEQGSLSRHPGHMTWPIEILTNFVFEERGGKTLFTITSSALNASDEEQKTFDDGHDSMKGGWGGTLNQLTAYLATLNPM